MNLEVNIRIAHQEDAELLAKLGRETFYEAFVSHPLMPKADLELYLSEAFSISQITGELNEPQSDFFLAEIGGQEIGYAKLISEKLPPGIDTTENPVKLKRLYIRQEFLGIAIGAALMSRCLDEARKNRHDMIWLTVWEHNRRAQDFYRRWNFKSCGTIEFQFVNSVLTDIVMQKSLERVQ